MTHSLERYFQCYVCDSRFSAKSSLYVHIKKHHSKVDTSKLSGLSESQSNEFNLINDHQRNDDLVLESEIQTEIISREVFTDEPNTIEENSKILLDCPVETCTRSYTSKSSLRTHLHKMHGSIEAEDVVSKVDFPLDETNTDFIVYTPYSLAQSNDQMIMVAPCDAVIFSSSENDIDVTGSQNDNANELPLKRKIDNQRRNYNQGSARTGLTYADVFKLKANVSSEESMIVGAQDVVLGSSNDLGESFLFTEDIPSMYFQDECQVLLLDQVTSENTINLRDID